MEKKAGLIIEEPSVGFDEGIATPSIRLEYRSEGGVKIRKEALSGPDVWLDSQVRPQAVFYSDRLYRACREAKLRKMTFKKTILVED